MVICLYALVVNDGYAHVQWWSIVDVDKLMCSCCQCWICSHAELVNGGSAHVNSWSMMDVLYVEVANIGYGHVK